MRKKYFTALIVYIVMSKIRAVYLFFFLVPKPPQNTSLTAFVFIHITELRSVAKVLKKYEHTYIVNTINIIALKKI